METIKDLLEFLKGMPEDTELLSVKFDEPQYVMFVDSKGNTERIMTKNKKWVQINILYNISG